MAASNLTKGTLWGAVAGLVAGLALAIFLGLVSLSTGGSFWLMAQMAGYGLFGEAVLTPSVGQILIGLLIHFAVSAFWGITYGWTMWGQPKGLTLMVGAWWGGLAWAVMYYAVAKWVGAGDFVALMPIGRAIVAHVLFGIVLSLTFLPFQERAARPGRIVRRHHTRTHHTRTAQV